jgi:hypothetical protein
MRAKIIDRWQELEAAQKFDPAAVLESPAAMRGLLLSYTEKVIALQGEVEEMRPQVQALERIAVSEGSMCITDTAKTLQVQPKALFLTPARASLDLYQAGRTLYRLSGQAHGRPAGAQDHGGYAL